MSVATPLRVGMVDSGVAAELLPAVAAARAFAPGAEGVVEAGDAGLDRLNHGTQIARLLLQGGELRLLVAQVFSGAQRCSAAQLAAAVDWLVEQEAALINLSVGLRQASAELRLACERAAARGIVLVASAPARGAPVFPAAYAQCIAVSGDARCGAGEISWLGGANADFGAHPCAVAGDATSGGASFAAARVAARIARLLQQGMPAGEALATLRGLCRYQGPERRSA